MIAIKRLLLIIIIGIIFIAHSSTVLPSMQTFLSAFVLPYYFLVYNCVFLAIRCIKASMCELYMHMKLLKVIRRIPVLGAVHFCCMSIGLYCV